MAEITIGSPREEDKHAWRELYEGYQRFYKMPENPQVAETVWQWIHDPTHATECLLAREPKGRMVGLALGMVYPSSISSVTKGSLGSFSVHVSLIQVYLGSSEFASDWADPARKLR